MRSDAATLAKPGQATLGAMRFALKDPSGLRRLAGIKDLLQGLD